MQGMVIIPRRRRRFKPDRTPDAEQLEEPGNPDNHAIAIFLHFKGLPLHNGCHGSLDTRLFAHDAVDLFGFAVADGGDQDQVGGQHQNTERDQDDPAALGPFADNLSDEHDPGKYRRKPRPKSAPGTFCTHWGGLQNMPADGKAHHHDRHENTDPIIRDAQVSPTPDNESNDDNEDVCDRH